MIALAVLLVPVAHPIATASPQGNLLASSAASALDPLEVESAPVFHATLMRGEIQPAAFQLLTRQSLVLGVDGECWTWNEDGTPAQAAFDTQDSSTANSVPGSSVAHPFTGMSHTMISFPLVDRFMVALPGIPVLTGVANLPESPPPRSH
ncbi:MAG: hypothetical protein EA415_10790 [Sphaerobacteraceae bacterium]|nr:MAG: hypothetical protein EA415_10790 [Sphaerobacteraceae bacterium]